MLWKDVKPKVQDDYSLFLILRHLLVFFYTPLLSPWGFIMIAFILFNFRFSHLLSWFHFSFVNVFCQEFTFAFNCLFFHISHPKLIKLILRYSFTTFTFHCSHQGHDTDSVSRVSRQACLWNRTSERFICDPTQPQ